ncbi:uncharacterized protein [Montipora capricornis]|uniref:uncharacterized protein n=1 Tax=Montipora capricornis TaxID=246305 RepID=UPI0035F20411
MLTKEQESTLSNRLRSDKHFEREYNIPIQKDQLVHLRNHVRGRNKIQDAWDSTLYKVVGVPRDNLVSVYTVEPIDSPGETKKEYTSPTVSVRNDHACPEEQVPTVQHDSDPVFSVEPGADVQSIAEPIPTAEDPDSETLPRSPRRTKRKTAGKHKNKIKQPRTAAVFVWLEFSVPIMFNMCINWLFLGIMSWTPLHDIVLCKEIIFVNPYSAKKKSVQRTALWQKIADNLNSVKYPHFIVDKRAVRDHIGILIQRFKRQEAQELKESGITPERTELDAAVEQIIAMEESADTEMQEAIDKNNETLEADRRKAEDMQEKAMETMGKTQKRKSEEGSSKARKSRRSGSEAVEYLKERAAEDLKLKSQEIELKKQEKEQLQALQTQQTQMFKSMLDQQQTQQKQVQDMQNLFLIQQQTQSQALMGIIEKLGPK